MAACIRRSQRFRIGEEGSILGQMMHQPLTIHLLIDRSARYHGDTEIVSIETEGGGTARHGQKSQNSRASCSRPLKRWIAKGDCCATVAWNNARHLAIYFVVRKELPSH